MAKSRRVDLFRGTLDMLVLRVLDGGQLHGYAIARALEASTDDALRVEEGSLYPALYRMQKRGWIDADWGTTDTNRRAKFYSLDPAGAERLEVEEEHWREFYLAVNRVLRIV